MTFTLDELIEFITLCRSDALHQNHESAPAFLAVREALCVLRILDHETGKIEEQGRVPYLSGFRPNDPDSDPHGASDERHLAASTAGFGVPEMFGHGEEIGRAHV